MPPASNALCANAAAGMFEFTSRDFERVCVLIHRQAGIALGPAKRSMVYGRLARRLRDTGHASFASYLDSLEASPLGNAEWQAFINALTTNLTAFWREAHHFPVLADHVARLAAKRPVRIWCCAASTGEEPYTIAITAMQACRSRAPPVSVLASDIDTAVLARARAGIYSSDEVARLDRKLLQGYFLRGKGANQGWVRVQPDVQALLRFRPLNLLDARWPIETGFDAIFCRNVMIYFDQPTQYRVLHHLARHLAPDGLLFAGHSENFTHARDLFELQSRSVYRLAPAWRAQAAPAASSPPPACR